MKNHTTILFLLLAGQIATAKVITEDQARQCAAEFFSSVETPTRSTEISPDVFRLVGTFPNRETRSSISEPAMYIFERDYGGYAIVSGDDVARSVLAYSLKGRFPISDMPDNMRGMLQWYADIIEYARQNHWTPSRSSAEEDPAPSVQLQTAQWSQGSPFNDLVAEINGQKPPIGCVATAIAIIMKYHRWPERGTGTLPSYEYSRNGTTYHVDEVVLGHEYNWDLMPDNYQNCTEEEAAQIARLLYDVAVMSRMCFYPGESIDQGISGMHLPDYFGYDKQLRSYGRGMELYTDDEWEHLIIDELNAKQPVLYTGYGATFSGHAFVIDGYKGRYFSINYGWGGEYNGYYTVTPIEGHEEDLLGFHNHQWMLCGIKPDQGGVPKANVYSSDILCVRPFFSINQFNLRQTVSNGAYGVPENVELSYFLYDRNGEQLERISTVDNIGSISGGFDVQSTCKISRTLTDGDMIALSEKDPQSGEWKPIHQIRASKIVFTERPLSDLIEIGYTEEPRTYREDKKTDFYIKMYKDLCWQLLGDTEFGYYGTVVNSVDYFPAVVKNRFMQEDEYDNSQCDTIIYEIWVPTGTYTLQFQNPMTDERMEIILDL